MEEKHCDSLKNIFYTSKREEWRAWLSKNYRTAKEVWFVFPMKETGEESLSYNDAVEEALCFGWIDSTIKHIDNTHRAQNFTPRKKGSAYSRPNIERLIWLEKNNLLMEEIRLEVLELIRAPYVFPEDIISSIKTDLRVCFFLSLRRICSDFFCRTTRLIQCIFFAEICGIWLLFRSSIGRL